ncbi:hypothetical protein C8R46DRAFT_1210907 [Mycena filopes]|nr:hypothetical protein C8R46DRAFT_1210907 [Mycena filopes]
MQNAPTVDGRRRRNQYLPSPPDTELFPLLKSYYDLGLSDKAIALQVMDHFPRDQYQISAQTLRKRRIAFGLESTQSQAHTWPDIEPKYFELRGKFPNMGARTMVQHLRLNYGMRVPEALLNYAFQLYEPDAVMNRKRKRFRRKRYWAAGPMDIVSFDQHDKWKRFGLWFHIGLDPFTGRLMWLRVWWTNRNPKLVTSYFLAGCREVGGECPTHARTCCAVIIDASGIPLITQSDLGSENYGIANCQTTTRQRLDPSLSGTLQHRWMSKKAMNVKPEAAWSRMRRSFTPGFEDLFDAGVARGLLDISNPLEKLVFRWLAVPWIQRELDHYVAIFNNTPRRADKHKLLPQGIPNLIQSKPHQFGCTDYKASTPKTFIQKRYVHNISPQVVITPELFDQLDAQWAPADDPVFELTPPSFHAEATAIFQQLGNPTVDRDTFWFVYVNMLDAFDGAVFDDRDSLDRDMEAADDYFEDDIELMPGQADLRPGAPVIGSAAANVLYEYVGGLSAPPSIPADQMIGPSERQEGEEDPDAFDDFAEFTDDDAD